MPAQHTPAHTAHERQQQLAEGLPCHVAAPSNSTAEMLLAAASQAATHGIHSMFKSSTAAPGPHSTASTDPLPVSNTHSSVHQNSPGSVQKCLPVTPVSSTPQATASHPAWLRNLHEDLFQHFLPSYGSNDVKQRHAPEPQSVRCEVSIFTQPLYCVHPAPFRIFLSK